CPSWHLAQLERLFAVLFPTKLELTSNSACLEFSHCAYLSCLGGSSWQEAQTPTLALIAILLVLPLLVCSPPGPWQFSQPIVACCRSPVYFVCIVSQFPA
ncbi:MAG TPA: hypothetical protein VHO28_13305, partial [Ignavibacteriales bacterium]|nr:hypothetical protein [Ignavibacteriales bacterium]